MISDAKYYAKIKRMFVENRKLILDLEKFMDQFQDLLENVYDQWRLLGNAKQPVPTTPSLRLSGSFSTDLKKKDKE